jgi:uncharacterized membrane protein YfcA
VSGPDLAAASLIAALAAALQGAVGFGFALVSAPILVLLDVRLVPGPLIAAGFVLTVLVAWRERATIHLEGVGWQLVGRVPGSACAAVLVSAIPQGSMGVPVAAAVLVGVVLSATRLRLRPRRWTLVGAGALSGFLGTTSSIGGPPLALVYQHESGPRLRGTLAATFALGCVVSLSALAWIGRFGRPELGLALALCPAVLLGFGVSHRIARFLDGGYTRLSVLLVSAAAAAILLVEGVLSRP